MKKTFNINISGIVFHIDEDAYERLQNYLYKITNHFSNSEEGREIIEDIEARIAELFQERLKDRKEVISIMDVEEVIKVMGQPEEIIEENSTEEPKKESSNSNYNTGKRMYRDTDNRILGGVCSGAALYFGIDPIILRVILTIIFFVSGGTITIAYIILWILIPEAKTTAQKLEMKGERVNVENIEKSIKDEFEGVKSNFKKMKDEGKFSGIGHSIEQVFHAFAQILRSFFKILGPLIGVMLIIFGVMLALGITGTYIFKNGIFAHSYNWNVIATPEIFNLFADPNLSAVAYIGILLTVCIPIIGLIYGGVRLIFRFDHRNRLISSSLGILWFIGFVLLFIAAIGIGKDYQVKAETVKNETIKISNSDTLVIKTFDDSLSLKEFNLDWDNSHFMYSAERNSIYLTPELDIVKSDNDQISFEIVKTARGESFKEAKKNTGSILFYQEFEKNTLSMSPFFTLRKSQKWRLQDVECTLKLPVGSIIYLDPSLENIIYDIQNVEDMWDHEMIGKYWIMTEDGLDLYTEQMKNKKETTSDSLLSEVVLSTPSIRI